MRLIGQAVDDGKCVVACEFLDGGLREGAADEEIAVFTEHADEIRNGFAFPPTSVAGQIQGGTSELRHRGFKANASPETRFFEYQGASVVLEQVWTMAFGQAGFESERPIEDRMKIVDIEIDEVSQVLHRYELDF